MSCPRLRFGTKHGTPVLGLGPLIFGHSFSRQVTHIDMTSALSHQAVPVDDDDDDEELRAAVVEARTTKRVVDIPQARGWSTPTFACHRNMSSCLLSSCCPCIQFGLNQRMAFGASGVKWTVLWLLPLFLLYALVNHLVPPTAAEHANRTPMSVADAIVSNVEQKMGKGHPQQGGLAAHAPSPHGKAGGHHPRPSPPFSSPSPLAEVGAGVLSATAEGISRSTAYSYALPFAIMLIGAVGAWRRGLLREKYGIGGSMLSDFVCHAACCCCSIAKEAREIRHQAIEEALAGAEQDLSGDP